MWWPCGCVDVEGDKTNFGSNWVGNSVTTGGGVCMDDGLKVTGVSSSLLQQPLLAIGCVYTSMTCTGKSNSKLQHIRYLVSPGHKSVYTGDRFFEKQKASSLCTSVQSANTRHLRSSLNMSSRGGAAAGSDDLSASTSKLVLADNSKASHVFICGATGKYSTDINGLYSIYYLEPERLNLELMWSFFRKKTEATEPAQTGRDGRVVYGRVCDKVYNLREMRIIHHDGYWLVKSMNFTTSLSTGVFARVQGGCALEKCTSGKWQIFDEQGKLFLDQPGVKMFTGERAIIEHSNLHATEVFIIGVEGVNSMVNGPYAPTEDKGTDGYLIYRKVGESGPQALCIEHFERQWQVRFESDKGSGRYCAYVEGRCALEDCHSRKWKVFDGKLYVDQISVNILTGQAASKASGHIIVA